MVGGNMETQYINKSSLSLQDILQWIDSHSEEAENLDCTHFEVKSDPFATFYIASMWVQGLEKVTDLDLCKDKTFEDAGDGWITTYAEFNSWLCYKEGRLFYISRHYLR